MGIHLFSSNRWRRVDQHPDGQRSGAKSKSDIWALHQHQDWAEKLLKNILYIRKMNEEEGNISENDYLQKNKTLANTSVS